MENNKNSRNEEVKVFLKIKHVDYGDEKPYWKLDDNRQHFTLFDPIRKVDSDKSHLFDLDKIFTDDNENSYIYEEVCRDVIKESLSTRNFCFISYGDTTSDKKSIIFGGDDCYKNINSQGIFLRFVDNYIKAVNSDVYKDDLSLRISYMCLNGNKLIDLSNLIGDISHFTQEDVMKKSIEIKNNPEVINTIKKIPLDNTNEVIHFMNKIYDLFYKLEVYDLRLYSRSHFIITLTVTNNSAKIISTISFVILSGSEKLNTMTTNPKTGRESTLPNTKTTIDNHYTFDSLINSIMTIKRPDLDMNKINSQIVGPEESKLTICLKRIVFNSPNTKFRIIGCIYPNIGFYDNVKDTLMFLFKCKKTIYDKASFLPNPKDIKRDDVIYDLENKIKNLEKKVTELNDKIKEKERKEETLKTSYKKSLETLKAAFNFEGDINMLITNNEYTKEAKQARRMREAVETVAIKNKRIEELEKIIEQMKEDNKKLKTELELKENDRTMVKIFTKLKEDNLHEENKHRITLEHSKEMENLRKKISLLENTIDHYKKELDSRAKMIQNLPNLLQENIKEKKEEHLVDQTKEKEVKHKITRAIKQERYQHNKEITITVNKYENLLKQKSEENSNIQKELNLLKNSNDKIRNSYASELTKMYSILNNLITEYKSNFDGRKLGLNSNYNANSNAIVSYGNFVKAKNNYDKITEVASESLTRINFPITFDILDTKPMVAQIKTKAPVIVQDKPTFIPLEDRGDSHASLSATEISCDMKNFLPQKVYTRDDMNPMDKAELINIVLKLQDHLSQLESYVRKTISSKRGYDSSDKDKESADVHEENERYKKKLGEQYRVNNSHKITIKSQERLIEKLNVENLLLKNELANKKLTESLSSPTNRFRGESVGMKPASVTSLGFHKVTNFTDTSKRPTTGRIFKHKESQFKHEKSNIV